MVVMVVICADDSMLMVVMALGLVVVVLVMDYNRTMICSGGRRCGYIND